MYQFQLKQLSNKIFLKFNKKNLHVYNEVLADNTVERMHQSMTIENGLKLPDTICYINLMEF